MRKILVVVGTYSEAILMAPLVQRLRAEAGMQTVVCLAAQQRRMLGQVLDMFGIGADEDFNPVPQWPSAPASQGIDRVIEKHKPDRVLMHAETAASTQSFHLRTPAGTREAGLCSYELRHATPGKTSGRAIDLVSVTHFVYSEASRANLLKEGVAAERICLTDSTAIDALRMVEERIRHDAHLKAGLAAAFPFIDPHRRLILVIGHRRENRSGGLESVCRALRRLATRPDVHVAYPVPPSPRARGVVEQLFANHPGITLIEPPDYAHSVYLMQAAYLILADSGDTPKEALSMGKPVLVMRDVAERPEVIDAGTVKLVGTDAERIQRECAMFLEDQSYYRAFSAHRNPYGDRQASRRIVEILLR